MAGVAAIRISRGGRVRRIQRLVSQTPRHPLLSHIRDAKNRRAWKLRQERLEIGRARRGWRVLFTSPDGQDRIAQSKILMGFQGDLDPVCAILPPPRPAPALEVDLRKSEIGVVIENPPRHLGVETGDAKGGIAEELVAHGIPQAGEQLPHRRIDARNSDFLFQVRDIALQAEAHRFLDDCRFRGGIDLLALIEMIPPSDDTNPVFNKAVDLIDLGVEDELRRQSSKTFR